MANNIALFKKYIDALDEVYKVESKTAVLESNAELAQEGAGANEIVIPKLSMDGLADINRTGGGKYVAGNVNLVMETAKFNFDRGRQFLVDAMDVEEAVKRFALVASEFVRTKVVPELDAFRYATYAGLAGTTATPATLADGAAFLTALITATGVMDDAEVPESDRHLFATPTLINAIIALDTTKSREMLATFASITKVPQARFYTVIDQLDGTTSGEEAGGFIKNATTGKDINFMIVHKPAVMQYTKHLVSKIFSPDVVQDADGWKFNYRSYGLAAVYENKVKGVYLHNKA